MNVIRKLRINNNLTQKELAEIIGVKTSAICMWEKGHNIPPTKMVRKLSKHFKVSTDEIINGYFEKTS